MCCSATSLGSSGGGSDWVPEAAAMVRDAVELQDNGGSKTGGGQVTRRSKCPS